MNSYLYLQFYRNRIFILALGLLFAIGLMSIYTGEKFLQRQQDIISKSQTYQRESIKKNAELHNDHIGSALYYIRFNLVNQLPNLAALNIGLRDLNPSIQGVTIRNLEEQRYNSDFYNPVNAVAGNFDFSFVVVFLFPLVIIAFCYNLLSEEEERGTWKLLSVQSGNLKKYLDLKMLVRLVNISALYFILILVAAIYVHIPFDMPFLIFMLCGWLYLIFWFALCRMVVSFRLASAQNALSLLSLWVLMNFIIPMEASLVLQQQYPIRESLKAVMQQREGYHNKWDDPRQPTMERFFAIYPQFRNDKVGEGSEFKWTWYYAMQHLGDVEAMESSKSYRQKTQQRSVAAQWLGYLLPNIHTQLLGSELALTGQRNYLNFGQALQSFHEAKRLHFYSKIFSEKTADTENWNKHDIEVFQDRSSLNYSYLFLPYLLVTAILFILSQRKLKRLC